jgi:hypothetical protein
MKIFSTVFVLVVLLPFVVQLAMIGLLLGASALLLMVLGNK